VVTQPVEEDEYQTVVERQDPEMPETSEEWFANATLKLPDHSAQLVAFEDEWERFPLARKLHFAAKACEDAREAIKPPKVVNLLD
jgi:hypothetical protein